MQLATLTGLTLIAAQAISLFLIFNLPPPTPDFYRVTEIEQAFRGPSPSFAERRPLQTRILAKPPGPAMEGDTSTRIRQSEVLVVRIMRIVPRRARSGGADRAWID